LATTRHRRLVGRGRRKLFVKDKGLAHTQKINVMKTDISNPKKKFEHIELPAKLPNYFKQTNKSNINQSRKHKILH